VTLPNDDEGDPRQGEEMDYMTSAFSTLEDFLGPIRHEEDLEEAINLVLSNIITVERTLTGDDADFLAGTQLDQPGQAGVYTIWAASTQGNSEITVTLGGQRLTDAAIIVERTNSEIRENEDTFFQMLSATGGRPVIDINIVTQATVRVRVKFLPA